MTPNFDKYHEKAGVCPKCGEEKKFCVPGTGETETWCECEGEE